MEWFFVITPCACIFACLLAPSSFFHSFQLHSFSLILWPWSFRSSPSALRFVEQPGRTMCISVSTVSTRSSRTALHSPLLIWHFSTNIDGIRKTACYYIIPGELHLNVVWKSLSPTISLPLSLRPVPSRARAVCSRSVFGSFNPFCSCVYADWQCLIGCYSFFYVRVSCKYNFSRFCWLLFTCCRQLRSVQNGSEWRFRVGEVNSLPCRQTLSWCRHFSGGMQLARQY